MRYLNRLIAVVALGGFAWGAGAADHVLTIGGGSSAANNQASLEKNVLYFQRVLAGSAMASAKHDVYFADGADAGRDLQFDDPNFEPPKANEYLARLGGRSGDLYLQYRSSDVPQVRGAATRRNLVEWFEKVGPTLGEEDRLLIYFTGHGGAGRPARNTTMELWGDSGMPVKEFAGLLDKLPAKVRVVLVMVQCHAGGFADVIFDAAQAGPLLSDARRCGFFATVPERVAAGCTADIDEENYKEYSTYFFAALSGKTRNGEALARPDYDGDGETSFSEAHAYVQITSETVDIPVATSDVFLRQFGALESKWRRDLVGLEGGYDALLARATPAQRAVLENLSAQLKLAGEGRVKDAREAAEDLERERKRVEAAKSRETRDYNRARTAVRNGVRARWPELGTPWHPRAAEILNREGEAVVKAVESHASYKRWEELTDKINESSKRSTELERKWVKYKRFLYVAESVALGANLEKVAGKEVVERYRGLVEMEGGRLGESRE